MGVFNADLLMIATVNFLALLSPGPNFAMIVQHSLTLSRFQALSMALGIATAGYIHQCIVIIGLGVIISQSPIVMKLLHFSGILYLAYLGLQLLDLKQLFSKQSSSPMNPLAQDHFAQDSPVSKYSSLKSFLKGFIFNILNPMSLIFFLGLFSSSVAPQTPGSYRLFYATALALMDFIWYSMTALVLSHGTLQKMFLQHRKLIDRLTGLILLTITVLYLYQIQ